MTGTQSKYAKRRVSDPNCFYLAEYEFLQTAARALHEGLARQRSQISATVALLLCINFCHEMSMHQLCHEMSMHQRELHGLEMGVVPQVTPHGFLTQPLFSGSNFSINSGELNADDEVELEKNFSIDSTSDRTLSTFPTTDVISKQCFSIKDRHDLGLADFSKPPKRFWRTSWAVISVKLGENARANWRANLAMK